MPTFITTLCKALILIGLLAISILRSGVATSAAPVGDLRPNRFARNGQTSAEVTGKNSTAFAQFFYGDPKNQSVYFSGGGNSNGALAYIYDTANHDVCSEGIGLAFFDSQGATNYANQFTLAGRPLFSDHSVGLVVMNAFAALAASHDRCKMFVEELWNAPVPSGPFRYYNGMLYLLGLLHCSGEFLVWLAD